MLFDNDVSATALQKRGKCTATADKRMVPKGCYSTVVTAREEAIVVTLRRHRLLLDG